MSIIDRYLQVFNSTKRQHFQLMAAEALFIVIKYEKVFSRYTSRDIRLMELPIVHTIFASILEGRLRRGNSSCYVQVLSGMIHNALQSG